MSEENKGKRCNCCLVLGLIVLAVGVIFGIKGGSFALPQVLAIIAGIVLILCGLKTSKMCKCCKK